MTWDTPSSSATTPEEEEEAMDVLGDQVVHTGEAIGHTSRRERIRQHARKLTRQGGVLFLAVGGSRDYYGLYAYLLILQE